METNNQQPPASPFGPESPDIWAEVFCETEESIALEKHRRRQRLRSSLRISTWIDKARAAWRRRAR